MFIKSLTLDLYIKKNFIRLFFYTLFVFLIIIVFNKFYLVLRTSISTPFSFTEILKFSFLKSITDIPILSSISVFIAGNMAISSFRKTSELSIFQNAGIGGYGLYKSISPLILVIMIFSFLLSFFINPLIEKKVDEEINEISENIDRINIETGTFNYFNKEQLILFTEEDSSKNFNSEASFKNIFIFFKNNSKNELILADTADKYKFNGSTYLTLRNGKKYKFNKDFTQFNIVSFDNLDMNLTLYNNVKNEQTKSLDTINSNLLFYEGKKDGMAELFWRIVLPSSIITLSILSVFLSLSFTNKKSITNFVMVLVSVIVYFVFIILVKLSVEIGSINFWESIYISILVPNLIFYFMSLIYKYRLKNHVVISLKDN